MLADPRTTCAHNYCAQRYALIQSDFLLRYHGFKWDCYAVNQIMHYGLEWSQLYIHSPRLHEDYCMIFSVIVIIIFITQQTVQCMP